MYAVYETATGTLKSTGTVLGILPDTLSVVELDDNDSERLKTGAGIWDAQTMSVIDNPNYSVVDELTIPETALTQLKRDMDDPTINSIAEIKTSIKTFANQIK